MRHIFEGLVLLYFDLCLNLDLCGFCLELQIFHQVVESVDSFGQLVDELRDLTLKVWIACS